MHAVRNQPQGMIEMPGEQKSLSNRRFCDQDQTLAMTLHRLAQEETALPVANLGQTRLRLPVSPLSDSDQQTELVFADSVQLELDLAQEMTALLQRLAKSRR